MSHDDDDADLFEETNVEDLPSGGPGFGPAPTAPPAPPVLSTPRVPPTAPPVPPVPPKPPRRASGSAAYACTGCGAQWSGGVSVPEFHTHEVPVPGSKSRVTYENHEVIPFNPDNDTE